MRLEEKNNMIAFIVREAMSKEPETVKLMARNVLDAKEKNISPNQKFAKITRAKKKVNECFHVVGETIHKVHANLKLNGKLIKFMIDSGATVNVIPVTFVKDNKMEHLLKKGKKLDITVNGGEKVRTEGTMRVELINPVNRRKVTASIMVVNEKVQPILSCSICQS